MISILIKRIFYILIPFFIIFPGISFAEIDATIVVDPINPKPYSPVKLTLTSYSFNVNTATITWSSGNKILSSGVGTKSIIVRTGKVGEEIPINVSVANNDGSSFDTSLSIAPRFVDLLYETPESSVPFFYEGKSLPGEGAQVHFTAMPYISERGVTIPRNNLSYAWYLNGSYIDSVSGIGKQAASFNLEYLNNSTNVKVRASSPGGIVVEKEITVYPHEVTPLFYIYDDVLGINYNRSLGKRFEITKDFTLALEPYFLSTGGALEQFSSYTWLLDGLPVTPSGGKLLSFNPKENSYGARSLLIDIENSKRKLQKARVGLDIVFDTRK